MFADGDGEAAVRIARAALDGLFSPAPAMDGIPATLRDRGAAFVTLLTHPARELRGCIGFTEPQYPLHETIALAARAAASSDPRFPPLTPREADRVAVEVSLLSPLEPVRVADPRDYLREIVIGRDGIVVSRGRQRGLLLPQVPLEWNWSVEEFLCHACMKAGLLPDAWFDDGVRIHRFQADVFGEEEPRGRVVRRPLGGGHEGHRG